MKSQELLLVKRIRLTLVRGDACFSIQYHHAHLIMIHDSLHMVAQLLPTHTRNESDDSTRVHGTPPVHKHAIQFKPRVSTVHRKVMFWGAWGARNPHMDEHRVRLRRRCRDEASTTRTKQ